jgi:hypothetical protein
VTFHSLSARWRLENYNLFKKKLILYSYLHHFVNVQIFNDNLRRFYPESYWPFSKYIVSIRTFIFVWPISKICVVCCCMLLYNVCPVDLCDL